MVVDLGPGCDANFSKEMMERFGIFHIGDRDMALRPIAHDSKYILLAQNDESLVSMGKSAFVGYYDLRHLGWCLLF